MTSPGFPLLVQTFFTEHLVANKHSSPQTIDSYRDTFRLLLNFLRKTTGRLPSQLAVADLDAHAILLFLDHLEKERGISSRSRNVRLAAIRSFFRYVVFRDPPSVGVAARVLAIPLKRSPKRLVGYLTRQEIQAVVAAPDRSHWTGRRDHALIATLYNTGARQSEVTSLCQTQVVLAPKPFIHLHGKGRKDREVPLWRSTARTLNGWIKEIGVQPTGVVFPSMRGGKLSADGVSYILDQAVRRAASECPSLGARRITPHQIRHSTAMHLLQAGVDLSVIALWLGHESIETTHMYVEADLATKERALEKLSPAGVKATRFRADDQLLRFLASL
ncbi:MAG: tyrosine-type recombinase/integrase [Acidobacteriota bacterium]